jgi:RNA polymerase sigma-70 factor (ECF subfamily)
MTQTIEMVGSRDVFDRLLGEIRPRLHRYCARMTGSTIDGEDVLHEAIVKALEAFAETGPIANPEGWIFRIAHNAALDFLRRRGRANEASDEDLAMLIDPADVARDREIAAASLHTFMRLPAVQRSSVILKDVLGYSLADIGDVTGATVPAVKAALHRGRARLRELAAGSDEEKPPSLSARERTLLNAYIDRFNARDVEAVRAMLADEVRLDLVARHKVSGRAEVAKYFNNYDRLHDWRLVPAVLEGRAAALVCDPRDVSEAPQYFVLLAWRADRLLRIRDFRYARYAIDAAALVVLR